VGTRTALQCMQKWYSGFGDRAMGVTFSDDDNMALVKSIVAQDPLELSGEWDAAAAPR
jgi:hypothetical protein